MLLSTIIFVSILAFVLIILGFVARVKIFAIPGLIVLLVLGVSIFATGLEVKSGTTTVESTGDPTNHVANGFSLVDGTNQTSLSNVRFFNGLATNISENNSAPAFDFRINFSTSDFDVIKLRLKVVNSQQTTNIQLYNFLSESWVTQDSYTEVNNFTLLSIPVTPSYDNFVSQNNKSILRIYHPKSGSPANVHVFDWVTLTSNPVTTTDEVVNYEEVSGFDVSALALLLIVLGGFGLLVVITSE